MLHVSPAGVVCEMTSALFRPWEGCVSNWKRGLGGALASVPATFFGGGERMPGC